MVYAEWMRNESKVYRNSPFPDVVVLCICRQTTPTMSIPRTWSMEPMVQKKVSDRRHLSQFGFLFRSVFIMKDMTNTWTDDNDNNDNHENNENIL